LNDLNELNEREDEQPSKTIGVYTYTWHLSIGCVLGNRDDEFTVGDMGFEPDEWDELTESQRQESLENFANESANNYIEIAWNPKK
jgi:hypothetical protein